MRYQLRVVSLGLLVALAGAALAGASGFGLFQHGARAMGQAGAFTARASEPSAVFYNPAAITNLEGFQLQAGLDFSNASDKYTSASGSFEAHHVIQFPPHFYATYRAKGNPFAFGIGIDAPVYYTQDWQEVFFPGRFLTRRFELRLFEVHPVVAYDLSEGWSVGGGLRYLRGNLDQERNGLITLTSPPTHVVEVQRNAGANVDAYGWDLSVHYGAPTWGWGAVYRSRTKLDGNGSVGYAVRDAPTDPALQAIINARFGSGGSISESFTIPQELRTGIWYAPYPELRFELDASYQTWSDLDTTDITFRPDPFGDGPTVHTIRDWKDTTALRLGVEGDVNNSVTLFGGIASEPSPVPGATLEPGFARGDAIVYAAGFTYNFPQISFDMAYSYFAYSNRGAADQELLNPGRTGTYSTHEQRWGASVRWRF
ncbi:MAG TPA: outer membrane protein transport protein [Thermoanaerobaculia bacterium]|nr:outer membrane protein transport protein [Thermoanaerobaculia bacterium]